MSILHGAYFQLPEESLAEYIFAKLREDPTHILLVKLKLPLLLSAIASVHPTNPSLTLTHPGRWTHE